MALSWNEIKERAAKCLNQDSRDYRIDRIFTQEKLSVPRQIIRFRWRINFPFVNHSS
jgi:hypothetical protein